MRVHVAVVSPQNYRFGHFFNDIIRMLMGGLEDAGVTATLAVNKVESDCLNILIGPHLIGTPQEVQQLKDANIAYVAVNTEVVNPTGLNTAANRPYLDQVYLPLLANAVEVWDLAHASKAQLRTHGIDCHWVEPGYTSALEDFRSLENQDIDFFFYGSMTANRQKVLETLARRGHRVEYQFDAPALYRNHLIRRTKVNLTPRQSVDMGQLPWTRILYQVHNQCLAMVEGCNEQAWLEDTFQWAPSETYVEACEALLNREDREDLAKQGYERLRQRPFADRLRPALERSMASMAAGRRARGPSWVS